MLNVSFNIILLSLLYYGVEISGVQEMRFTQQHYIRKFRRVTSNRIKNNKSFIKMQ